MSPTDPAIASLPKIHLHCHLEGSLRAETFVELTRRDGISTRYRPGEEVAGPTDPAAVYQFADFREFLLVFAAVSRALRTPDDYARLAREFVADALAQNVRYGELFISPSVWSFFHRELDLRAAVRGIVAELRAANAGGAEFALIVDVTRNFGADAAMRTAQLAASLAGEGVIGIGLGGDEARFPAELFSGVFAYARSEGLAVVAHAGEADGAHSVRAAVEDLEVSRIGHGVRALEDPAVVELLVHRGVTLEICPTSNYLTGAARRDAPHPLIELDARGVRIAIDADDPTLFGTTISAEYAHVAELAGMERLRRFIAQAIESSFASPERKAALHAALSGTSVPEREGAR
jgi:adenosine deaminase